MADEKEAKERKKKFDLNVPAELRAIEDLVVDWRRHQGQYILTLEDPVITTLYVSKVPMGFAFETKTVFSAPLTLVNKESMDSVKKQAYRELKRMEFDLHYKGIIRRTPVFVPRIDFEFLSKALGGVTPRSDLIDKLNSDKELIDMVRSIKPSDIRARLKSMDVPTFMPGDKVAAAMVEANYYKDPGEITWIIIFTGYYPRTPGVSKKVRASFNALKRICDHVIRTYKEVLFEVGGV